MAEKFEDFVRDSEEIRRVEAMPVATVQDVMGVFHALTQVSERNRKWAVLYAEDTLMLVLENLRQADRSEVEVVDTDVKRLRQRLAANARGTNGQ